MTSKLFYDPLFPSRRICAELLARVVLKLFPATQLMGGGVTRLGFYYDFIFEQPLPGGAAELIEVALKTFIKEDHPIRYLSMMRENGETFFLHLGQPGLANKAVSDPVNIIHLIEVDQFFGLSPELTLETTGLVGAVKLLDFEIGQNKTEVRIVGTVFPSPQDLKQFTKKYDHYLKKKDHRQLGPELNLFSFSSIEGETECFWHPKGELVRTLLRNWVATHRWYACAQPVRTPSAICFLSKFDQTLTLIQRLFERKKGLPIFISEEYQYADLKADSLTQGEHWGLISLNGYRAEESTIYCSAKELRVHLISSLLFIEQIITLFEFEAQWSLIRSRQKQTKGRFEQSSIEQLAAVVRENSRFSLNPALLEEDQLLGPTLELSVKDSLGREWPLSRITHVLHGKCVAETIRVCKEEANLLSFTLWGSTDRLIALLLERYEGEFPLWLAPEQIRILTVGKAGLGFAGEVYAACSSLALRVKLDERDVKLSEKVHEARREKVPFLVIIGEQEARKRVLAVESISRLERSQVLSLEAFLAIVVSKNRSPDLNLTI